MVVIMMYDGVGEEYFVGACIKILNESMKVPKLWLFLFQRSLAPCEPRWPIIDVRMIILVGPVGPVGAY